MTTDILHSILDLARWAPSGDNTQCWKFEIAGPDHVVVHGFDTRQHCVYDLDGHPSQVSIGAMLETMNIAASAHGLQTNVTRRTGGSDEQPLFDVRFTPAPGLRASPLLDVIKTRSVQRRAMSTRALTDEEKAALEASVGSDYDILWLEGRKHKMASAKLMFKNAKLRLTMPEAFETHRAIIEWGSQFSESKVPDQALGVDNMTLKIMRWGMASWSRMAKMNAILGTGAARLQMDFLPGMACAAHFVLRARQAPVTIDDYVAAGRAVQRFWLTATHLKLAMQPELTPLIFSRYVRNGIRFSKVEALQQSATVLQEELRQLIGKQVEQAVYMGRIGAGPMPVSRSVRRPLADLMVAAPAKH